MRLKSIILASLAATAAFTAAPAAAQQPQTIQGAIEPSRSEHRIRLEQGRRYTITARSDAFDTVLRVFAPGNAETPIAENDDAPELGLNSRVTILAEQSGDYLVRVGSFGQGGAGAYTVNVEAAAPLPALITTAGRTERATWRLYEGSLAAADPRDNGRHYEDYQLQIPAGRAAMIHLSSASMDTYLKVYTLEGRGGEVLAQDDDSGGGTDSFIYLAPATAGTYVVRVTSFGEDATGAYRLRISEQPGPVMPEVAEPTGGEPIMAAPTEPHAH